jgi:DNA repair photolyase
MRSTIYKPKGLAAENCGLALNTMDGCVHGCRFCYVPLVRHVPRAKFHAGTRPRVSIEDIEAAAAVWKGEKRPVQLCFTTDPYQLDAACCALTRAAISVLHKYGFPVSILTKGGPAARRDFDLYRPGDSFGVSLTFIEEKDRRPWEPGAAPAAERIQNLVEAKKAGIDTYISLEPVIDPRQTLLIIDETTGFTDHYKIGPLNYYTGDLPVPDYDRKKFITDAIDRAVVKYERGIHVKKSFSRYCGSPYGYRIGVQLP